MSIGLSRNAQRLLTQLVQVHHSGEQDGLSADQLSFTLSVGQEQTTVEFAAGNQSLQTNDSNAILVLRANGLIEEFTTIARTSSPPKYVVTQNGLNAAGRSVFLAEQEASGPRRDDIATPREGVNGDSPSNGAVKLISNGRKKSHG